MTTNSPNYDAAMNLAGRVGANFKTLRDNKRALACNLILATAVEGFKWRDAWAETKKAASFIKLEKDEQNQFNVMGTACRIVVDNWDKLAKDEIEAVKSLKCAVSGIAKRIKDAEKAAEQAEKDAADKAAMEAANGEITEPREQAPVEAVNDRSAMIEAVAAMFDTDADAKSFTPAEITAMLDLIAKVDAFKAATVAKAQKAA